MTGPLVFFTFSSKSSVLDILKMSITRPVVLMPLIRWKLIADRIAAVDFSAFMANMMFQFVYLF